MKIRRVTEFVCIAFAVVSLAGCATGRGGRRYYQVGYASWYGREYHGKLTASGERFNMRDMTAAHRTLPFGTRARVMNLGNGRSVVVRINDRGPFKRGRIIDLSWGAARRLDMVEEGVVKVAVRIP
jgi:rare lipoprotein A